MEERKPMTTHGLIQALQAYVSDNSHSRNVDERWLADYLRETIDVAAEVGSGGLKLQTRNLVNSFRVGEIQKELTSKRREVEVLERDLQKLTA